MDKFEVRGPYIKPRKKLPNDPVAVERWHAIACYNLSIGMPEDIAKRLIDISENLAEHARELAQKEEQLANRRKILFDRIARR